MAKKTRNTLKGYFESGKKPTEGQYANLIDSHALLNGENTGSLSLKGNVDINGNVTASSYTGSFVGDGNGITFTNITASNGIKAGGTVTANLFTGDGSQLTGITSSLVNISAVTASFGTGSLIVSGNLYHASSSTNILLGIETTGSILPGEGGTYDLGSPTTYFKDIYVSRSNATTVTAETVTTTGNISASGTSTGSFGHLQVGGGNFTSASLTSINVPAGTISSSYFDQTITISGSEHYLSASAEILVGMIVTGSILPGQDSDGTNGFDLGSPTAVWRDLWLSPASLKFVSSSGEITRLNQAEIKDLKSGKAIKSDTAVEGNDRIVRAQAIFHETNDSSYIKTSEAGVWSFNGTENSTFNVDLTQNDHFLTLPQDGTFATAGNISASKAAGVHILGGITQFGGNTVTINGPAGHITASGNISASNSIYAYQYYAASGYRIEDSSGTSRHIITENDDYLQIGNQNLSGIQITGSAEFNSNITSSGTISSSGVITGRELVTQIDITVGRTLNAVGNISGSIIEGQNLISDGHITASGNISASGNIIGGALQFNGTDTSENATHYIEFKKPGNTVSNITNGFSFNPSTDTLFLGGSVTIAGQVGTITGLNSLTSTNITSSGNISASGTITGAKIATNIITDYAGNNIITDDGTDISIENRGLTTEGQITVAGINSTSHITASGNISASGTIYANNFESSGENVGGITFADDLNLTGDLTASGNISASGFISTNFANIEKLYIPGQGVGTMTVGDNFAIGESLQVVGNISASNAIYANSFNGTFIGALSSSTQIASDISGAFAAVSSSLSSSIAANNIITAKTLISSSAQIASEISGALSSAAIASTTSGIYSSSLQAFTNITASNVSASGTVYADNFASTGGDVAGISFTDHVYVDGNITASGDISASGTVYADNFRSTGKDSAGITFDDDIDLTGHITTSGNISSSGFIYSDYANINKLYLSGSGVGVMKIGSTYSVGETVEVLGNINATGHVYSLTSESLASRITTAEAELNLLDSDGLISSSAQIASDISGSITAVSSSLSASIALNNIITAKTLLSSSAQISSDISGALSATAIASLTAGIYSSSLQTFTNITASGNISASGTVYADNFQSTGGDVAGISFTDDLNITGNITASGDISASGTIYADNFKSTGGSSEGISFSDDLNLTGHITASGNISSSGFISSNFANIEKLYIPGQGVGEMLVGSTFAIGESLQVVGNISASNEIHANKFNGTFIGALSSSAQIASDISGAFTAVSSSLSASIALNDTITAKTLISSSAQIATDISGAVSATAIASTNAGIYSSSLQVFTNITASNVSASGTVYADNFASTGGDVAGISFTDHVYVDGNITASGDISASGTIYADNFRSTGQDTSGIAFNDDIDLTGNITASGNISSSGFITSNFANIEKIYIPGQGIGTGKVGSTFGIGESLQVVGNISASNQIHATRFTGIFNGALSSSAQIASDISGSITALSSSLSASIASNNIITAKTLVSSSAQISSDISGSLSATAIASTNSSIISSSAQIASNISGALSTTSVAALGAGIYSSSLQEFTSITASGDISASGTVYASNFESAGDSSQTISFNDNLNVSGHITASGNISASGTVYADNFQSTGGDAAGISFTDDLNITGNITASGNISSSGFISAGHAKIHKLFLSGSGVGTMAVGNSFAIGETLEVNGNVSASSFSGTFKGVLSSSAQIASDISGSVTALSSSLSASIASNNIITAKTLVSSSAQIASEISGALSSAAIASLTAGIYSSSLQTFTNITASGNISASGTVYADNFQSTGGDAAGISFTDDFNLTGNLTASGNISGSASSTLTIGGALSAGAGTLTSLNSSGPITSSSDISASGTITANKANIIGDLTITDGVLTTDFANIEKLYLPGQGVGTMSVGESFAVGETVQVVGNVSASGNINVGGNIDATQINSTGDISSSANVIANHITASGNISASGTVYASNFESAGTSNEVIAFNDNLNITGNITASGDISASGTIYANNFRSTGLNSAGITFNDDIDLTGHITASGNISGSATSTLNIGGLSTLGTISATQITSSGIISSSNNIIGLTGSFDFIALDAVSLTNITASSNISSSGIIESDYMITDKLYIPGQGVGTLKIGSTFAIGEALHVIGNVSASVKVTSETGTFNTLTNVNTTHVTASGNILASGNVTGVTGSFQSIDVTSFPNLVSSTHITASGNISGSGTSTLTIGGALTAGAGTLTSLNSSGPITSSGNISSSANIIASQITASYFSGDGSGITGVTAEWDGTHNGDAQITGSLSISGSTKITGSIDITGRSKVTKLIVSGSGIGTSTLGTSFTIGKALEVVNGIGVQGGISSSGTIITSQLTASSDIISSGTITAVTMTPTTITNVSTTHVTASGNISSSGTIQGLTGSFDNISLTAVSLTNITASGGISSSLTSTASFGKVEATSFSGDGSGITGVTAEWDGSHNGDANITGSLVLSGSGTPTLNVLGQITASGNISSSANITGLTGSFDNLNVTSFSNINSTSHISASGNISGSNLEVANIVSNKLYISSSTLGNSEIGTSFTIGQAVEIVGSVSASGTIASEHLYSSDDAVIDGDLTVGYYTSLQSASIALVSSSLIPDGDDAWDLGSSTKQWKDLYIDGVAYLDTVEITGSTTIQGTLTVGTNDTGHDVKLYGATSGQYILWDESADELALVGDTKLSFHDAAGGENIVASADGHLEINSGTTLDITAPTVDINASTEVNIDGNVDLNGYLDISGPITASGNISGSATTTIHVGGNITTLGNLDVDGTTNLDAVDIDGTTQIDGTVTVGVDDTGYDVKFFGATSGQFMLWDQSADELALVGDTKLSFHDAAGGENIVASANGHLEINAGATLDITAPTVDINASTEVNIDGNVDLNGQLEISGHITASGNISASGTIYANNFESTGEDSGGITFADDLNLTGHISASGNVSASGIVYAEHLFSSDDAEITDTLTVGTIANVNTSHVTASGNISGSATSTITVGGALTAGAGTLTTLNASSHITASGNISSSGFITSNFANIEKAYLPGQGIGHMVVGNTFAVGETLEVVGTTHSTTGSFDYLRLDYDSLPTSDPNIKGVVWRSGADLKISAG